MLWDGLWDISSALMLTKCHLHQQWSKNLMLFLWAFSNTHRFSRLRVASAGLCLETLWINLQIMKCITCNHNMSIPEVHLYASLVILNYFFSVDSFKVDDFRCSQVHGKRIHGHSARSGTGFITETHLIPLMFHDWYMVRMFCICSQYSTKENMACNC